MNKFVAAAILATGVFVAPAALPVQAAAVPAKCALLPLLPDCIDAWKPTAKAAAAAPAKVAKSLAKPHIKVVRCEKATSTKYLLSCSYK
jgi:hypothetical protein